MDVLSLSLIMQAIWEKAPAPVNGPKQHCTVIGSEAGYTCNMSPYQGDRSLISGFVNNFVSDSMWIETTLDTT